MAVFAYLSPDLVLVTYSGSPITFRLVPLADDEPVLDLESYDQIEFSVWSGTRENPGTKLVDIRYTGVAPLYITVEEQEVTGFASPIPVAIVDIPAAVSLGLAPGQYFAELWGTPPGGEATFMGFATWNHTHTTLTP